MIDIPLTELVPIKDIKTDPDNPNKMTRATRDALKKNIERFGFLVPVILNKEGVIADGQHRYEVAKDLGMSSIPAVKLPLTDVDRRMVRQVMNKLRGVHDATKDSEEYKVFSELEKEEFIGLMGMTENEFDSVIEGEKEGWDLLNTKFDKDRVPIFKEELYFTFEELQVFEAFLKLKRKDRFKDLLNEIGDAKRLDFHKLTQEFEGVNQKRGRIEEKIVQLMRDALG